MGNPLAKASRSGTVIRAPRNTTVRSPVTGIPPETASRSFPAMGTSREVSSRRVPSGNTQRNLSSYVNRQSGVCSNVVATCVRREILEDGPRGPFRCGS
ncbi:hypothetical protein DPMN_168848 [Dreissena polymorpha]|uniref:Uncharacterized protein n=1 Tax=Dreissena polymorpha TaxID=45954 RepID=A0A9D4F2Q0_DREPO|nr:hypothetical protein DPMN_168848 [Dreissena polymorpha]